MSNNKLSLLKIWTFIFLLASVLSANYNVDVSSQPNPVIRPPQSTKTAVNETITDGVRYVQVEVSQGIYVQDSFQISHFSIILFLIHLLTSFMYNILDLLENLLALTLFYIISHYLLHNKTENKILTLV